MAEKKKKKTVKKKEETRGRPPAITAEIKRDLEHAFSRGYSDLQACAYAGVAERTFYDFCKNNPDFSQKREVLKKRIDIIAKENMIIAIETRDKEASKWWLERKCKDEFSTKQEVDLGMTGDFSLVFQEGDTFIVK